MRPAGRGHGRESGGIIVEAAFVLPALFLFVLAAVDVGLWVFGTTQAASAARDGARVGILVYRQADVPASGDALAVRQAVQRRIGEAATVQVQCVGPADTDPLPGGCATASVVNPDRIHVRVSWPREPLGFVGQWFGPTQTVSAAAVMVIHGRPPGVALLP